jgi:hypothetical protein
MTGSIEMDFEPADGRLDDHVESARLFEEMSRAGHDGERCRAVHPRLGRPVQLEDLRIILTDDQQSRRFHPGQGRRCEVWPAASAHHGLDVSRQRRSGNESRCRSRARAEETDREGLQERLCAHPLHRVDDATAQQWNVEDVMTIATLGAGQQIEQKRPEPRLIELLSETGIPRTVATRPAPVGEDDQPGGARGKRERSLEPVRTNCDGVPDLAHSETRPRAGAAALSLDDKSLRRIWFRAIDSAATSDGDMAVAEKIRLLGKPAGYARRAELQR